MSDAPVQTTDKNSRYASLVLGMSLPADTVLYLVLPLYADQFGITLAEAGILLAANRLIRIAGYSTVARLYGKHGDRASCTLAAAAAAVCAAGYAACSGFWALLVFRLLWGLSYAALNLSTQALATAELAGAARRTGQSRALIALGPMLALPLSAVSAEHFTPRPFFLILAVVALCAVPVALRLPAGQGHIKPRERRFRLPGALDIWSFVEGLVLDGLFIVGLSFLGRSIAPTGAVVIAGLLLGLRYLAEIMLSPVGGHAAEKYGAERMLVTLSVTTSVALVGFGAGWLWACAAAVVVLRALQLPLIAPIVAQRYPGSQRVHALATRAIWRDIGAGVGPMMAGVLLPVTSSLLLYGTAAACLAASALACRSRR
ncbi:MFS transporter [Candidimonas humi]|uniref:MFS transporter n=1 Tax=Candidimonas humi TaxID=683355 RepID=A0ABV8P1K4_9BURK|nr:MFS transporter [Candidimonas humi]